MWENEYQREWLNVQYGHVCQFNMTANTSNSNAHT
jgi:hypothetical protein